MTSFINNSKRAASGNSRSLKAKLNNFEFKYEEFVNNCSAYLKASDSESSRPKIVATHRDQKIDSSLSREILKLKRQNEILLKTVEEINRQERTKSASAENFELFELKEKLRKSEETVLMLKSQIDCVPSQKTLIEENKKSVSPSGKVVNRIGVARERNFTPVERKTVSPIYRTVPQKSRERHSIKKLLQSTQEELEKVKIERDQLKIYKKLSKNPPMPASLSIISSQYETEVQKSQTICFILEKNIDRISRLVKEYIKESTELIPFKRIKELDPLKMKILEVIRDNCEVRSKLNGNQGRSVKSSIDGFAKCDGKAVEAREEVRVCSSAPITAERFFDSHINKSDFSSGCDSIPSLECKEWVIMWNDSISKELEHFFSGCSGFINKTEKTLKQSKNLLELSKIKSKENSKLKEALNDLQAKLNQKISETLELKKNSESLTENIQVLERNNESNKAKLLKSEEICSGLKKKLRDSEELSKKQKDEINILYSEMQNKELKMKNLADTCEKIKKSWDFEKIDWKKKEAKYLEQLKQQEKKFDQKETELNEFKEIFVINQKNYEDIITEKNNEIDKFKARALDDRAEVDENIKLKNRELDGKNKELEERERIIVELKEKIVKFEEKNVVLEEVQITLHEKILALEQSKQTNESSDRLKVRIKETVEENQVLQDIQKGLKEKIVESDEKFTKLQQTHSDLNEKIRLLNEQLQNLTEENKNLNEKIAKSDSLNNDLQLAQSHLNEKLKASEANQLELTEQLSETKKKNQELISSQFLSSNEKSELEEKLEKLKEIQSIHNAKLKEYENTNNSLQSIHASLQLKEKQTEEENKVLIEIQSTLQEKIKELEDKNSKMLEAQSNLLTQLESFKKISEELEHKDKILLEAQSNSLTQLEHYKKISEELGHQLEHYKKSNKEFEGLREDLKKAEDEKNVLHEVQFSLNEKLVQLKQESENLKSKLKQHEEFAEIQNKKLMNYEESAQKHQQVVNEFETKLNSKLSVDENLRNTEEKIRDYEKLIKEKDKERDNLEKIQTELQEKLKNDELVLSDTKKELHVYIEKLKISVEKEQKLSDSVEELNKIRAIDEEQKKLIIKLEEEMQKDQDKINEYEKIVENLNTELFNYKKEVSAMETLQRTLESNESQLIIYKQAAAENEKIAKDLNEKLIEAQTELFKSQEDLQTCVESMKFKESQIEALSNSEKDLRTSLNSISAELTKHKDTVKILESEKSVLESTLQAADLKIKEISQDLASQTLKPFPKLLTCHESSFNIPSKSSLLSLLQTQLHDFLTTVSEALNKDLEISDSHIIVSHIQELNNLATHLQASLTEKDSELQKKNSEIENLKEKFSEIDLQQVKSTYDLFTTNEELKVKTAENSSNEEKIKSLQEELSTLQDYYDSLYSEKIQLIEKSEEIQKAEEILKNRFFNEQKHSEDLELANEELTEQLKQMKIELESTNTAFNMHEIEKNREINILKEYIKNLEALNASLENTNSSLEIRFKSQLAEKQLELEENTQNWKTKIEDLNKLNVSLQETVENLQTSVEKFKDKVSQLENEILVSAEKIKNLMHRPKFSICMEFCDTIEAKIRSPSSNYMSPVSFSSPLNQEEIPDLQLSQSLIHQKSDPDLNSNLNSLMMEIEFLIQKETPTILLDWCKKILGHGNYILRYNSSDSIYSEESQILDKEDIGDENQDLQLRVTRQGKIIDSLIKKVAEKKERLKLSELNIKTLQSEIRKLDNKIKQDGSIDLEYLKTSVLNFTKGLKKIDNDSLKCLRVIQAQLGLNVEQPSAGRKWGIFKKN